MGLKLTPSDFSVAVTVDTFTCLCKFPVDSALESCWSLWLTEVFPPEGAKVAALGDIVLETAGVAGARSN